MQITIRIAEHSKGVTCEMTASLDGTEDPAQCAAHALAHRRAFLAAFAPDLSGAVARQASGEQPLRKPLNQLGREILVMFSADPSYPGAVDDPPRWRDTSAKTEKAFEAAVSWLLDNGYLQADDRAKSYRVL